LAQCVLDIRRRRYAMAALGLACGLAILLIPVQTHAVKLDLVPPPDTGR